MPYVITEPCAAVAVKDKSCTAVCPVDCIREGMVEADGVLYDQLFIDSDACIDCGLCEPECPADAIFPRDAVSSEWRRFTQINADFYGAKRRGK